MKEDKAWYKLSLVENLTILTMLSLCFLPCFMLYLEKDKGSFELEVFYKVHQTLEEKIAEASFLDFDYLPSGETSEKVVEDNKGVKLDLRSSTIGKNKIIYKMQVETIPIEFSAIKDSNTCKVQNSKVFESFKRIEIIAYWGEANKYKLNLLTYKEKS